MELETWLEISEFWLELEETWELEIVVWLEFWLETTLEILDEVLLEFCELETCELDDRFDELLEKLLEELAELLELEFGSTTSTPTRLENTDNKSVSACATKKLL